MKIIGIRDISGPNIYSYNPVLVMTLDLEDLAGKETYEVAGFNERLLALLPGMHEHVCGLRRRGGFVERLRGGTWFGHVVEHVALELSDALNISVYRGKTVSGDRPGRFLVAVTYTNQAGMRYLLQVAVDLVDALVADRPYPLEAKLSEGRSIVEATAFGPSTQAILSAAEARCIPVQPAGAEGLMRLGYGRRQRWSAATLGGATSVIATDIASNKHLTKRLLEEAGIPVPGGEIVQSAEEACRALSTLGAPVVLKPLDGNQGKGVSLNLCSERDVMRAFETASAYSKTVLVEHQLRGRDYRVVVVNGRMVAAAEKTPANVMGDGEHTLCELINQANQDPRRGDNHSKPLSYIHCDDVMLAYLERCGLTLDSIPARGARVLLRESANLSTGAQSRDVTGEVHPSVARMCERAARVIGLDICGVDLIAPDIGKADAGGGGIVELNAAPGIRMHHFPAEGQPRDVAGAIVDMMFPDGSQGRIPIIGITGTNGKTTVTRMIGHVLCQTGATVGMTTTDGIWIDCQQVACGDMTGPWSARVVLNDPSVDVAVLETARGGILRSGLGCDWYNVAVFTNVQADHLGQDGIETVDDVYRIKRLLAERVRDGGVIILNADDERLAAMPQDPKIASRPREFVFFSLEPNNMVVQRHVAQGGVAYILKGDWIEEHVGSRSRRIVRASDVPCTLHGSAQFQIANVLACVAACRTQKMPHNDIARALTAFDNNGQNAGRVNIYEYKDAVVVLDYGHNTHAISAISRMVRNWGPRRSVAVLGLPGDRTDELLRETAAEAARNFDMLIAREDADLRGRAPGEMAELIRSVAVETCPGIAAELVLDEIDATVRALDQLCPGDALVCFCDRKQEVADRVRAEGGLLCNNPGRLRDLLQTRFRVPA